MIRIHLNHHPVKARSLIKVCDYVAANSLREAHMNFHVYQTSWKLLRGCNFATYRAQYFEALYPHRYKVNLSVAIYPCNDPAWDIHSQRCAESY